MWVSKHLGGFSHVDELEDFFGSELEGVRAATGLSELRALRGFERVREGWQLAQLTTNHKHVLQCIEHCHLHAMVLTCVASSDHSDGVACVVWALRWPSYLATLLEAISIFIPMAPKIAFVKVMVRFERNAMYSWFLLALYLYSGMWIQVSSACMPCVQVALAEME